MRVLTTVVAIVLILLVVVAIVFFVRRTLDKSRQKTLDRRQQELARYAPAVLNGDPLVDVVTAQGKQLDAARNAISELLADQVNVYLPTQHSTALRAWLDTQGKGME